MSASLVVNHKLPRRLLLAQFFLLTLAWYGYGFYLIADGLL